MLDTFDTTQSNDDIDDSRNSGSSNGLQKPQEPKPRLTPERSDTVRGIVRVAILANVFKDVVAIPDEHWTFLLKLADLDGDELTWLQIGIALDPKIDPDQWLDKRTITRLKRNAIRAWNRFRKWQQSEGWALVMRSPGGLRANQENVPLAERDKLVSLFDFVFLRVLKLAFEVAKASHLWRKGQRSEALRRALEPLLDQLRLVPGESVEWERTEVAAPNTKGALATPQRFETGLENLLKRYPKDINRRRLILKEHGEWLDRMNATYGDGPKGTEATEATPPNKRAYTIPPDRIYAKCVHTPTRCSCDSKEVTGSEKVLTPPFSSPNPCTLLLSSVSVQPSHSQEIESPKTASNSDRDGEEVIQPNADNRELEVTQSLPSQSLLEADFSSNLTHHNAWGSTLTLAAFATYAMLPIEWLVCLGIGMRNDQRGKPYLGIPHLDTDRTLLGIKQRVYLEQPASPNEERFIWVEGSSQLYGLEWGMQEARATGELIICEGITDQLTFRFHGMPAVGLSCASDYRAIQAEHLAGITSITICRDNDDDSPGQAGMKMAKNLSRHLLDDLGFTGDVFVVKFNGVKDASDCHKLVEGDSAAFKAAFRLARDNQISMREAAEIDRAYEARRASGYDWVAEQKLFVAEA